MALEGGSEAILPQRLARAILQAQTVVLASDRRGRRICTAHFSISLVPGLEM